MNEIIGMIGTIILVICASVKTESIKGSIIFRALNLLGSIIYIIYGILLPSFSTIVLNATLAVINFCHIFFLIIKFKKQKNNA